MIYTADDDDIASEASSLVSFEDEAFNGHSNPLVSAINRIIQVSPTLPTSPKESPSCGSDHAGGRSSCSVPTTPTSGPPRPSVSEREASLLARACRPDDFSCQAIMFSRELLLPHLTSYPVHRRIALLADITCGCKDFSRLEHELPFVILDTVNDAFDSPSVVALIPSLALLSNALRYNVKAFALSGAFPLLGLTMAKLYLIFKDAKVFEQLVEISDIVVKRWILADMKENLTPFLQSFIIASGRFWPAQPPLSAQQLMRTLINGCHSVVAVKALFDCACGRVVVGDDTSLAILGSLFTIEQLLLEMAPSTSGTGSGRSASPLLSDVPVSSSSSSSNTAFYAKKLITDSALPLVSELISTNGDFCKLPKVFVEVTDLLTVITNTQYALLKAEDTSDWWTVMVNCIEMLDISLHELTHNSSPPNIGVAGTRASASNLCSVSQTEPITKYNALLLALMCRLEEERPHFAELYAILSRPTSSSSLRSLDVITRLSSYFCDYYLSFTRSPLVFVDIRNFLVTFYARENRQSVREIVLTGLSNAFISHDELISEMVVSVVKDVVFPNQIHLKTRPLITDTSSSKSAQAALAFIKQLFHATRPARNRFFFISQALTVLFTAANGGSRLLIETLSKDIFGIIVANTSDSLMCTGPVIMKVVETISSELSRRFESSQSTQELLTCWRPTLLRFLCLCSALDTSTLGHVIVDRHFVEGSCLYVNLEDLLELLNTSSPVMTTIDRREMILIPGLKWSAELSVPVLALKLLALALKSEKDPVAFKCFAALTARFFAKRTVLHSYRSAPLYAHVNELIELLCKCAATSIKRCLSAQQPQQQSIQQPGEQSTRSHAHMSSSPHQLSPSHQVATVQHHLPPSSPYCLITIFRTFLLVPSLDFAIDEERRCMFFRCLLKALKSPVSGDAMDCLTLCLIHMPIKHAQDWLAPVTLELSKLTPSVLFAPNLILLLDTLRQFAKHGEIEITQDSYLAVFTLVLAFANPCRFGYLHSSLAFNSMFAWFLDSPVHVRQDLGSYVLKQLAAHRAYSESTASSARIRYYDEMTELTRDVVTEYSYHRNNDFQPSRLVEFESAPTWILDNDRVISFARDDNPDKISILVRSPSAISIFQVGRSQNLYRFGGRRRSLTVPDEDSFDSEVSSLVATFFGSSTALSLRKPPTQEAERGLKMLDLILPFQKFKFGVLFLGPGQTKEEAILSNCYGTPRYERFIERLGQVSRLMPPANPKSHAFLFTGGMEVGGEDGRVALTYADDYCQVAYHIATLMPNHAGDPKRNRKKRHIGNDYVIIIYNASGATHQHRGDVASVISGSFAHVTIVVTPLLDGNSLVQLFGKHDVPSLLRWSAGKAFTIPERILPDFVRMLAMHAEVSARCASEPPSPLGFNWLERMKHIRRLRGKLSQMSGAVGDTSTSEVVYQ